MTLTHADTYLSKYRNHCKVKKNTIENYLSKNIYLFVINFHYPNYNSIQFIRDIVYVQFAKTYKYDFDILFVGPKGNKDLKVLNNHLPPRGYYSYHSLYVALKKFKPELGYHYSGYFLVNDDSCLQPELLNRENHEKAMSEPIIIWRNGSNWLWNGKKNLKNKLFSDAYYMAVKEITQLRTYNSLCHSDSQLLPRGFSDFLYLPKSNISAFISLESIMFKHYVFLENAVPYIMSCLKAIQIKDCNHGKMIDREICPHLHPVKFSKTRDRLICMHRITNETLSERPDTW